MFRLSLSFFLILLLAGCIKSDNFSARMRVQKQKHWEIIYADSLQPDSMSLTRPTMDFELSNLKCTGNGGCNSFSANFLWNTKSMEFGQISSTKMFCGNGGSDLEAAVFGAMRNVNVAKSANGDIQMLDDKGKLRLILTPKK